MTLPMIHALFYIALVYLTLSTIANFRTAGYHHVIHIGLWLIAVVIAKFLFIGG